MKPSPEAAGQAERLGKRAGGKEAPDLVEVHLDKNGISSVDVTDITQIPFDPSHNFKTRFYVEVMKRVTGTTNVHGLEWKSIYEIKSVTPRAK